MSEVEEAPRTYSGALLAVIAITFLGAIGGLIWTYTLSGRIAHQETALSDATQQNLKMAAALRETNARLTVATDELGKSLGLTQKQMDTRAQQIIQREQADNRRLESAQKARQQRRQRHTRLQRHTDHAQPIAMTPPVG